MNVPEIIPKEWGPSAWKFIHYVALKYPKNPTEEDKKQYFVFFYNLQFILPCERCAKHYKDNIASHKAFLKAGYNDAHVIDDDGSKKDTGDLVFKLKEIKR